MGRASQHRGRTAELELVKILRSYGFDVRPGEPLNYGTEPDIIGLAGLHCEVKRHEQLRIPAWLGQAEKDAQKFHDGLPAVFFRRNREPWSIVMRLTDFLTIYGGKTQ